MPREQYLKPKTFHHHLTNREEKKRKFRRNMIMALVLTPMVDCFSILVIFLLQTFSANPQMSLITKGVVLPTAATANEMRDAPVLAINENEVFLDQKPVGDTQKLLREPGPLMRRLSELRELWMKTHPKETFKGEITLQAHRELSSSVISRFMGMLPSEHYGLIQLAVVAGTRKGQL